MPVSGTVKPVAVNIPVPALYVIPASVLGAKSPVALSNKAIKEVVSVVSATVIVAGTISALPLKEVPPIVLAVANIVAVAAFPVVLPELPDVSPVTFHVTLPSKLATIVPAVPENTSELFVASGIKVNFPAESS